MRQRHESLRRWSARLAGLAVLGLLVSATAAQAQWQNKSTMTFSKAVMVPGATLQPGEYVFHLMHIKPTLHTIQILDTNQKTVAIVQAVPKKRMDLDGDSELVFRNTPAGSAPALKAWFYPGTRYGHEFIYSEDEARKLASQSETLVLSGTAGGDRATATLVMYDAEGKSQPYAGDDDVTREWDEWSKKNPATDEDTRDETEDPRNRF